MIDAPFLSGKIPVTIITGFLGSGKTTMIRKLLENINGKKRLALIINEFGDIGIDGSLLKGCGIKNCSDADVIELNNGCICCTVADDFVPMMTKLLARETRPDHILIETSGLALPQPLIAAFNWWEIKPRVTIDGIVTIIDTPAILEGRFADDHAKIDDQRRQDKALDHESPLENLFENQIRAADLIVLNKTELIDEKSIEFARKQVTKRGREKTQIVTARYGNLSADLLLGLSTGMEEDIGNRKSRHKHRHVDDIGHSHDDFDSFVITVGAIDDLKTFVDCLKDIVVQNDILRLKGFVNVHKKRMRLVLHAVGSRLDYYYDRPWKQKEERVTCLVVIGFRNINKVAIADAIARGVASNAPAFC